MPSEHEYWFPAKRYGWGWGPPTSWQGWVVLAAFVALLVVGFFMFSPSAELESFITCVVALCALFIAVCWLTGEKPRWRWGGE